ncbi:DUF2905 domain-containing protein [Caldimonas tepidiphila]|uniref:DUF2905 domain-containing protein n=1 Tax=Caldimonas tepidiphila TaxID=2315841 RepID=UPI000E5BCAB5|nr:DUF2905 domain-containing protein [Caldimonas tepidiphila]
MLRWMIVMVLALALFSGLRPWLEKLGLGRLPGDFHFRLFGREFHLPIASSVLLSFIALAIGRFL